MFLLQSEEVKKLTFSSTIEPSSVQEHAGGRGRLQLSFTHHFPKQKQVQGADFIVRLHLNRGLRGHFESGRL